jgi:hypothetical protein
MDEFAEYASRESEARRIVRRQWFWLHFAVFAMIQIFLFVVWALSSAAHKYPWFIFPLFSWGTLVAAHAVFAFVVRTPEQIMLEREAREAEPPR